MKTMVLLINRNKPQEDLYRRHEKILEGCGSFAEANKRLGRRPYDPIERRERRARETSGLGRTPVLDEAQVIAIKNMRKQGMTLTAIAKLFAPISYSTIRFAAIGAYDERFE